MIKKLKVRFITLAMVAMTVLIAVIVTGMNIINYNKVVSDADARLEVLEQNSDRLLSHPDMDSFMPFGDMSAMDDLDGLFDADDVDDDDDIEDFYFGRKGKGGPSMSRDEAEESRFFSVTLNSDCETQQVNIERIYSVDTSEAAEYAKTAAESGEDNGFIGNFRYAVNRSGNTIRVTCLDCSRVLESFKDFLKASIIMSLVGLALVFAVIVFFSGRIVKPVAESYEKQKRFITDAGHEIKTPLAIIKANLDVIEIDPDSTEECLREIGDQTDRLAGLTNDLVYLSRMEEAGNSMVMTEVPISDVVSETVASFDALAKERSKRIETDIEPMLSIEGSNKELEKLVSILVENAVKYSAAAEPIKIKLKKEGKNVVLEVANATEEPVTNEGLSHVFERFYRTDSSRNSATGGHGIGLSMASAIVTAHKGKISAHTTDGNDFIVTAVLQSK